MRYHLFDWVQSTPESVALCFKESFREYHTGLRHSVNGSRLTDVYGFQFPHDYPRVSIADGTSCQFTEAGEGDIAEDGLQRITSEWPKYYDMVHAKYARRIERFLAIVSGSAPVVVLCRWPTNVVKRFKTLFSVHFQKENVFFVNSTRESNEHAVPWIYNCYTEASGTWNDADIWKAGIETMIARISGH